MSDLLFDSLQRPSIKARWRSFTASYAVQALAVGALIYGAILAPTIAPPHSSRIELTAPDVRPEPQPTSHPRVAMMPPAPIVPETSPLPLPSPRVLPPTPSPVAEVAPPRAPHFDTKVLNAIEAPKTAPRVVATNTFGGSSAAPSLSHVAPSRVQTGGFGDPNGVAVNKNGSSRATIAAVGSFDHPAGSGYGNGTGGSRGLRGTVASAGFGNGVAGGDRAGSASPRRVQSTAFSAASAAAPAGERSRTNKVGTTMPVAIQSKPMPAYTEEARRLHVEGEVLLKVIFAADGQVHVLNVVRGLGHGLDENAQRAARGIRFTPAMRDGHPVDYNAVLHIVFQLS